MTPYARKRVVSELRKHGATREQTDGLVCTVCRKSLANINKNRKFCSTKCRLSAKIKYNIAEKKCKDCEDLFKPKHTLAQKYCSKCQENKMPSTKITPSIKICIRCGELFSSTSFSKQLCSFKCKGVKRSTICLQCGNTFETTYKVKRFCSRKCKSIKEFKPAREKKSQPALEDIQERKTLEHKKFASKMVADGWMVFDSGWPDLLATRIVNGKTQIKMVEVKGRTDSLRGNQPQVLQILHDLGIDVSVVWTESGAVSRPPDLNSIIGISPYCE